MIKLLLFTSLAASAQTTLPVSFAETAALVRTFKARRATTEAAHLVVWRGRETAAFTSPAYAVGSFDHAVLSWNASGAALFELEADGDGKWRAMGRWSDAPQSVKGEGVDVDTLVLKSAAKSLRFRVTPQPGSVVTLVAATYWTHGEKRPLGRTRSAAWGRTLEVPQRSQGAVGTDPSKVCSPTSLSMVLAYYGINKPVEEVARGVFDRTEKIYGNWPFNTAYAHRVAGLETYVQRFMGLEDLEAEIAAGRPVIISHKFEAGDLDGAPISRTDGHVIVVVGFTKDGDVVVNDPAGRPGAVRRVYKRAQLDKTWLVRASGVAYVLRRP